MELVGTAAVALAVFCLLHGGVRRIAAHATAPRRDPRRRPSEAALRAPRVRRPAALGADPQPRRHTPRRPGARVRVPGERARPDPGRVRPAGPHPRQGLRRQGCARCRHPRGRLRAHPALLRRPAGRAPDRLRRVRIPDRVPRLARQGAAGPDRTRAPGLPALVRPLAAKHGLEHAVADVADALHEASAGGNLLARQIRSAVAAYGTGTDCTPHCATSRRHRTSRRSTSWPLRSRSHENSARALARPSANTNDRSATPSGTGSSVRPRRCSRSLPQSWPGSTCPRSSCSSWSRCSPRRSVESDLGGAP